MVELHQQRSITYEVPPVWTLPDLDDMMPTGGRLESAESVVEDTYLDTASGHLLRLGVALSHRTRGADTGWRLTWPGAGGDAEVAVTSRSSSPPAEVADLVVGVQAGEELKPNLTLSLTRRITRLVTQNGTSTVDLIDELVSAATMGEASRLSTWREIRVELILGNQELLAAIDERLRSLGAEPAEPVASARLRALGVEADQPIPAEEGTLGALVIDYLAEQIREIVRCDLSVRRGEPDVHRFRVALRRLRSTLRVYGAVFDADRVAALEPELVWIAGLLGGVRDRDILRARLAGQVAELPAELVWGPVAADLERTLSLERSECLATVTEAMRGERYAALVRQLIVWLGEPPLTEAAAEPAAAAGRYVQRAGRKVRNRLARADGDVVALHRARKAAKRYRYAAELSGQDGGRSAAKIVKATEQLQTLLGEHQDAVVSAAFLRRMAAEAGVTEGRNGFTYGYLVAMEVQRADRIAAEVAQV